MSGLHTSLDHYSLMSLKRTGDDLTSPSASKKARRDSDNETSPITIVDLPDMEGPEVEITTWPREQRDTSLVLAASPEDTMTAPATNPIDRAHELLEKLNSLKSARNAATEEFRTEKKRIITELAHVRDEAQLEVYVIRADSGSPKHRVLNIGYFSTVKKARDALPNSQYVGGTLWSYGVVCKIPTTSNVAKLDEEIPAKYM